VSDSEAFEAAVRSDDPREALSAIRDRLAEGVLAADGNRLLHLAPLAKQLVEVIEKIQAIPEPEADSVDDSREATERILRSVG
jgi:uncharacterized protein related to proFAR isomerase